ncbi:MAG: 16S rRNA (adenine(1518)-N(6)/adenine(1519)-N(6))-dimethyltransferase RsmA [Limisphaerales bacterium]
MKLHEMRRWLSEGGIQLTKSLGQNFLHEEKVIAKIAAAAELTKADKVLEIGPGLGPLTEVLLAQAGEVLAIEMDRRLVDALRQRWPAEQSPALQLIHADALRWLEANPRDWRGWKLVANLPYSVASPLLVELALAERGPDRMVVTLQLEVARRLRAQAGEEDYGLLTLLVGLNYEARGMFRISAGCFFPPPNVDSACLTLVRRADPPLAPGQTTNFVRLVKRAFSQRRKRMAKLLREDWPEAELAEAMNALGLSPEIRAEAVTREQFVALTRQLSGAGPVVPGE